MAHIRQANRFGGSADLTKVESGYVASGEGQHSRRVANGKAPLQFAGRASSKTPGEHTLHELIGETERRIEWMECELKIETRPKRRAKLTKDIEIKGKFLTRLLAERDSDQ